MNKSQAITLCDATFENGKVGFLITTAAFYYKNSREPYQGFVPYPDADTFEAYYQQKLEKKRSEQERAEHIANQHSQPVTFTLDIDGN